MRRSVRFLLLVGGLGGLMCGIDFGIIAVSLPYIRALSLYTDAQIGWIVGGVMLGGIFASAVGGCLCDRLGRRAALLFAASLFLVAIPVICLSGRSFSVIMAGRMLQGMSCGLLSMAMPLYLAEALPADYRGRGTAIFQLFLGIGLVLASISGIVLANVFGAADAAADQVSDTAKSMAWRISFWWTLLPGAALLACTCLASESPAWLERKLNHNGARERERTGAPSVMMASDTLFQRKYVIPFLLALAVLTLNKLIGFGCVVPYAVVLFQKAGLAGAWGNAGDCAIKVLNLAVTLLVVGLVERKGRTFLLRIGTAGLSVSLAFIGLIFLAMERGWLAPSSGTGCLTLASFLALVFFYAFGPGVCVWLVLSELMPTRIRAKGMSIALFSNQFVAWGLAAAFLPVANVGGFGLVFLFFATMGMLYFATARLIPETKGKSLDELEALFDIMSGTGKETKKGIES